MEVIDKIVNRQRMEYAWLWIVAVCLMAAFECGWLPVGLYAGDGRMTYLLGTVGILLAIAFIPLSLKLFSLALVKKIRQLDLLDALKTYRRWGRIRLLMMAAVVWPNVVCYYLTLNNIGALCAWMGLTASLFCLPGRKRLMQELDITEK